MTTIISLYGKPFSLGFSDADNTRRSAYFKSDMGNLTPQEKSLLLSLGIDSMLENSLKPYLAEFFSSLQTCSSDSSLILSKDCETAYFVIWSAMFHNRAEISRRLRESKGEVIDDLELASDAAFISGMQGKKITKPQAALVDMADSISRLFTLMIVGDQSNSAPANIENDIDSLFTLMIINNSNNNSESHSNQ
jgi:hypothetical protein